MICKVPLLNWSKRNQTFGLISQIASSIRLMQNRVYSLAQFLGVLVLRTFL
jgi:hypothetical protein